LQYPQTDYNARTGKNRSSACNEKQPGSQNRIAYR
jgi:hypothetical protein